MNVMEVGRLVAKVSGACPQQKMNSLTPDAWGEILGSLDYDDCLEAAMAVAGRQPFVAPSEVVREIADRRAESLPHSNACRDGNHDDCRVSWCGCGHHPRNIQAVLRTVALPVERGGEPRAITAADLPRPPD